MTRTLAGVLLAVSVPLAMSAPAAAWDDPPSGPGGGGSSDGGSGTQVPEAGTGESSDSGGYAQDQVRNCSIVSSPSYLGMSCGSAGGDTLTVKEILGDDPVPDCWHEPMTASELEALGLENTPGPDGSTWYWERCLKGVDPETKTILPEGISFEIGYVSIKNGDPTKTLTDRQQDLVDFHNVDGMIPSPVAVVSPSAYPRVGQWVSFFNGTDDEVVVNAGGVVLRATVDSVDVEPLGEGEGDTVSCAGTGYKAQRGDTPDTHPGCWYKYLESSAAQPDQKYPALMTAHWVVEVSEDGGATWRTFNTFDKSQVTTLPVTEIQALVIR